MLNRIGEETKWWPRSGRCFYTDRGWWVKTREGQEFGPYGSKDNAEKEFTLYANSHDLVPNYGVLKVSR